MRAAGVGVAARPDGPGGRRRPGRLLGPDDRLRARRAAPPAPAAARRLARRLRARTRSSSSTRPTCCWPGPRSGSWWRSRAACRCRLWAPAPLAAAGVIYLLARADVYHLVPLAAVLPVLLATAPRRARGGRHGRRRGAEWPCSALIALQGLDRKRIQLLDPPPLATIDVDVADGVKAPDRRGARAHRRCRATCAPASRPDSRSSSPTRASTWSASATRSSTCWSAVPTRPATT